MSSPNRQMAICAVGSFMKFSGRGRKCLFTVMVRKGSAIFYLTGLFPGRCCLFLSEVHALVAFCPVHDGDA